MFLIKKHILQTLRKNTNKQKTPTWLIEKMVAVVDVEYQAHEIKHLAHNQNDNVQALIETHIYMIEPLSLFPQR